jgi:hypothetical protein
MQFLSPWMLWGMAAVAAPIALHFWQRRRVIQLPFSTLKYLRLVAARTSRSAKLENILLLLLRCAIFLLLAFAASRPAVHKKSFLAAGGNVQRTVVLVIDHSMSMGYQNGGQTRLEMARAQALAVLGSLNPGDEAAVFALDDQAEPLVPQPTQDRSVIRHAIEGLQPSLGATDFAAGLIAARKVLAASSKPVHELYLFTDNQASGWQFDPKVVFNESWKKADPSLVIVRPDDVPAANAALAKIAITTPLVTAGARLNGVATVANFSAAPLHDVVTVNFLNTDVTTTPVEVPPNRTQDVTFDFQIPATIAGKVARGVGRLQGDNLPADDRFFFSVPIHQAAQVVVFEGASAGPARLHSGFYLRRALAAGTTGGAEPPALNAAAIDDADLSAYSAVFLADIPRLSDRAVVKLDNFIKGGGTVVYFPGDLTDISALPRADFLPAVALRFRDLPTGRLSSQITDPGNPLFANTWNPGTPFPPLPQHRLIEWRLKENAVALVTVGGSEGFVLEGNIGAGRSYLINASPDRAWGDFPLSPAFLPLVQQIALQSTERGRAPAGYTVGEPIPAGPTLPRDQPLRIGLPDGSTQPLLLGDKTTILDHAAQVGFYQVGTAADPALVTFEVNASGRESDLTPITEDALQKITPHDSVAGLDQLRLWLAQSRGLVPLWPTLLLLAALAFAAESVLSNLAARHRAQGEESQIKTGRLNKRRVGSPFRAGASEPAEAAVPGEP